MLRMSTANLWINSSRLNLTGGPGGNAGTGGTGSSGGGGGGGYSGSGGGGYSGSGGEGTVNAQTGDGVDAQVEFYCIRGSIPVSGVSIEAQGGAKGDGLTKKGGGSGGAGKGRLTAAGGTPKNIPRLIPITTGPADGSLFNNMNPTLSWMKCLDGVQFPNLADPVWNYEVQIDADPEFGSPDDDAKDIEPTSMSYIPDQLSGGRYHWRVRALYEGGKSPGWSAVRNFLKNGPPILVKNIPALSFPEDTNLTHAADLNVFFTDDLYPGELGYSVSYEQDPTKVHAMMDGNWLNLYAMEQDWFGAKKFTVRATDKGGISLDSNTFTVTVTPVNDPPYYKELPTIVVTEDEGYTFDLGPYVDDVDNPQNQLKISLTSSYATVEGLNITFVYPREIGTDRINVSLTDGMATAYALLEVRINGVNDRPVTLPVPSLTTNEDTKLVLDLTPFAMDEENTPTELSWRAENVPVALMNVSIDERNVLTITPLPNLSGEGTMLLIVHDRSGSESSVNLTVRIIPVNDPPVVSGMQNITAKVTVQYRLDVKPYVSDVDNDQSELRVTTNSMYATVSGFVITFQYPNDESLESEMVRITVSDGRASGHQDILVTLSFPPVFTEAIGELSLEATREMTVDLTRYVNDREDGPTGLKWAVSGVDKSLLAVSIDGNGTMKIRSVGEKTGTDEFVVAATDTEGNRVNQTVRVSVTPKKSVWGSGAGADLLLWALPVVLGAAIIGGSVGFYMVASRRKKRLEEEQARQDKAMLPTSEQKMVTLGTVAAPQAVPAGKVCFACGSRLVVYTPGTYQCTKCGRTQK